MTLQHMIYFKTVCDCMNMTKAAEVLYVSQPTISAAIQDIERECGVALFSRRGNQIRLTEAGENLLSEVTPIVKRSSRIDKMIQDGFGVHKLVRIGYSYLSASDVLVKICAKFYETCPDAALQTKEGATDEHYRRLENGEAEIIFATRKAGLSDEEWEQMRGIGKQIIRVASPMMLCISRQNPLAKQSFVSLQQLSDEPLTLLEPRISHYTKKFLDSFGREGLHEPKRIQYVCQTTMAISFARYNVAGAILPADLVRGNSDIVAIPFDNALPQPVYLLWRKDAMQFQAVAEFVRTAKEFMI